MDLILWRHAEAEDPQPGQPDAKRRLTPRGQKQARKMAHWLRDHLPHGGKGCRILVSPADRTQETATALELPFELEPKIALDTSVSDHLAACGWPKNRQTVLLVGHQPNFGRLAASILTGTPADWPVRKGGIWWFSSRGRSGIREAILRTVFHPDLI